MRIAIAQIDVAQGDFQQNLQKASQYASNAKLAGAQLLVFPEMFVCGFNYKRNIEYLKENGNCVETTLCQIAKANNIAICGSVPHLNDDDTLPSNRLLFISESGEIVAHYDKIHLFSVFNEHKYVKSGNEIVVANTTFGDIGLAVCYDIRFPDIFVKMAKGGAKLIIVTSAFPHPRSEHWQILTKARAIENQCFVVAVNQAGIESFGKGQVQYFGLSAVIDPWGRIVAEAPQDVESLTIADIDLSQVDKIRNQIPSFSDRREDLY